MYICPNNYLDTHVMELNLRRIGKVDLIAILTKIIVYWVINNGNTKEKFI